MSETQNPQGGRVVPSVTRGKTRVKVQLAEYVIVNEDLDGQGGYADIWHLHHLVKEYHLENSTEDSHLKGKNVISVDNLEDYLQENGFRVIKKTYDEIRFAPKTKGR